MSTQTPALPVTQAPVSPGPAHRQAEAIVIATECGEVRIPANLTTHEAFREWARSDDCPEKLRISWLQGIIWVEVDMERLYSHNQVKTELTRVLGTLVRDLDTGLYLTDGMLLTQPDVGLSTVPDGIYVSYQSLHSGRVRQVPSTRGAGTVELQGAPEVAVEVVSHSSEEKDFVTLPGLYYQAGIDEFWRADARQELLFEIFRRGTAGYEPTRLPDDWWRSDVFGRDFRLTQQTNPLGQPRSTLEVRLPLAPCP